MNDWPSPLEQLRRVPLFGRLSDRELAVVARMARERRYPAGHDIVRQGDGGIGVYVLTQGRARVVRRTEQGVVRELDEMQAGAVFGELAVLDEAPRVATVRAIDDCVCLVLPRWEFLATLRANGELATELLQELARRLRRIEQMID
jgi:CRP/FNR family transcriptional regulator, cyclic AMP receptor protein